MPLHRLTARSVEAIKQRGRYSDGGGLVLQVSKWGTKAWVFRYQRDGRERHMGLGPAAVLSLAAARDVARACRLMLLEGRDPLEERREAAGKKRAEAAHRMTFKACAEAYIAAHEPSWRNPVHRAQWRSSLAAYVYPGIGELSVGAIDTALVLKCLEPIWRLKPETAKRVRGRIESVLDWAAVRGYRQGENPARWRGHLDHLLPAPAKIRPQGHHEAMPYGEVPAYMAQLRARSDVSSRALEFTILTAARTNEVISATIEEINSKEKTWTVPPARMKAGKEHRVPLVARAAELVETERGNSRFLFPGLRPGKPLSNMAMLNLLKSTHPALTVHGFRSSFRDWAAERTNYPREVAEMALAHTIGDKVEAAYRRGDLFEKRRRLMADWARYCHEAKRAAEVIPLRGRADA